MRRLIPRFVALAVALVLLTSAPAHAQTAGEQVTSIDAVLTVDDDGSLLIEETIAYDFGANARRGIFRDVPTRQTYDDRHDRRYPMTVLEVSSETAPDQHEVITEGPTTRVRIGDPDRTITGQHTYRLVYRIEGALNAFDDHDELYWNIVGGRWDVPIARVTARVSLPDTVTQVACFAGPTGSTLPCETATSADDTATFSHAALSPGDSTTVVVGLPKGAVPEPAPILDERFSIDRAFARTTGTVTNAFALLGLVVAGLGVLAWRVGRDRRAASGAVDAAFAPTNGPLLEERVPLFGGRDVPVMFEPPDGLRPGQLGTLIDERANPLDVTATIVDLAVRGYLRIEEIPKEGWFGKPDWKLHKLREEEGLVEYERILFGSLFSGGHVVLLSDLKDKFAKKLDKVQDALYADARKRKWFAGDPQKTRTKWALLGVFLAFDGVALTVAAAIWTEWAIVPLPLVLGGLLLIALSNVMPRRTAGGTAVLLRTLGFKRFIDESEKDRARFAEQQHLFTEYLPYAVVFGATEKWAKAFAGLDGELPDQSSWYVGTHAFSVVHFNESLDGFTTTTAGTIASTPSSSGTSGFGGGGFSGGGGGGGGGGSW
ncbi:MAG TPA: DUF2207 domain-containing protein [Acidimicrobiales bacterium]|nr:DUF2207 domain-containing protein [Acidimicrobiales bacterium]